MSMSLLNCPFLSFYAFRAVFTTNVASLSCPLYAITAFLTFLCFLDKEKIDTYQRLLGSTGWPKK